MIRVKKEYFDNRNLHVENHLLNGNFHREDGPAVTYYRANGTLFSESYFLYGKRHREDGPAYISYYENGDLEHYMYFIYGKKLTKEEWFNQLSAENKLRFAFGIDND
jgi:antitoxin component YwqK of YwqJK toxin-antitoxin module